MNDLHYWWTGKWKRLINSVWIKCLEDQKMKFNNKFNASYSFSWDFTIIGSSFIFFLNKEYNGFFPHILKAQKNKQWCDIKWIFLANQAQHKDGSKQQQQQQRKKRVFYSDNQKYLKPLPNIDSESHRNQHNSIWRPCIIAIQKTWIGWNSLAQSASVRNVKWNVNVIERVHSSTSPFLDNNSKW